MRTVLSVPEVETEIGCSIQGVPDLNRFSYQVKRASGMLAGLTNREFRVELSPSPTTVWIDSTVHGSVGVDEDSNGRGKRTVYEQSLERFEGEARIQIEGHRNAELLLHVLADIGKVDDAVNAERRQNRRFADTRAL